MPTDLGAMQVTTVASIDVTESIDVRKSLAMALQRYAAAAEASRDGLLLLRSQHDASGKVVDFEIIDTNQRGTELLNSDTASLLGRNICHFLPQIRELGYLARFVRVFESGQAYEALVEGFPLGFAAEWVRWNVVAIGDGVAISIGDVSHEQALACQLSQARRLESIGSLAIGIAHDFNNMLSAILGFGGLALESQAPGSKAHADIEQVVQAAQRAAQMTRYLLAFSNRQELEPKTVDLGKSISELAPILSRLAGSAIELSLELGASQLARLDPCQFEQALVNLVANARDAMPHGGKLVISTYGVTLRPEDIDSSGTASPGKHLCVSVVDNGTGMDAATRQRIFEPFFTTKGPSAGTGLGLASVYGFVRQTQGQISVESELGRGTVVRLYFPLAHGVARKSSAPPPRCSGAVARTDGCILLVERDDSVRHVARRILMDHGYDILDAADASSAEAIAEQSHSRIDLLLTAMRLPHVSGLELARRIRLMRPDIGVVLMSGAPDLSLVEYTNDSLQATFLQKPFTPIALLGKVQVTLQRIRSEASDFEHCGEL